MTDIVEQAKSLCGQYIRARLKRSGMFNRKLGLQRLRSMANLPGGLVVCEVFSQLHAIGLELERMHPKLYSGVAKQVISRLQLDSIDHQLHRTAQYFSSSGFGDDNE